MGRTYDQWIAEQDQAVVAKTRAGDEGKQSTSKPDQLDLG